MSTLEDITPEDSVTPVYLDPTPLVPVEDLPEPEVPEALITGRAKLLALGLTDEEIQALTGSPATV